MTQARTAVPAVTQQADPATGYPVDPQQQHQQPLPGSGQQQYQQPPDGYGQPPVRSGAS